MHGAPRHVRSDNGPEFIANAIQRWFDQLDIETLYIELASLWQNGYAESFFSRLRDEFLAAEEFESLLAARSPTKAWQFAYNHHRPRSSLGYRALAQFAARCANSVRPTASLQPSAKLNLNLCCVTRTGK